MRVSDCVKGGRGDDAGALRVCPCIADRDRRTDAAWSNSSGTKAARYGAILCLSLEIHRSTHIYNTYIQQPIADTDTYTIQ